MRAIIIDLDGTLLRTDKTVSEYTYAILKECHDRDMILMAATARPERAVAIYHDRIDFEAMTTLSGARIVLPHGVIENGIASCDVENILKKITAVPDVTLSMETGDGLFSNVPIPGWGAVVFDKFPVLPTKSVIYRLLLNSRENDIQREIEKEITADINMTVLEGGFVQIMSAISTKWRGIKTMLKAVDVQPGEAVYFGDNYDDIESMQNCGVGIAVSNAADEVLAAADVIAECNDMDGVAVYIEKNLL